ncbi:putative transposase, Ptta/En/Spm, plant [Sesbania bispinosa]|nr:putative transposase, Ptta/En/Spm, plant [Sesbania bispinosa]
MVGLRLLYSNVNGLTPLRMRFKKDVWGFSSINFSRLIHTGDREEHDPYIEASQAHMVYYMNDEVNKDWSVVVHLKPRDLYDMGEQGDDEIYMPRLKRIRNLLKSIDGSSSHAPSSSNAFVQPSSAPNDPVHTPPHLQQVMSSTPADNEASQSPNQTLSQPTQLEVRSSRRKVGRLSNHHWTVDAIDEEHDEIVEKLKLKVKDIHNLFEKWSDMPDTFFNNQWDTLFNPQFCFKVNEDMAKRHLQQSIGKKWREYRIKLYAFDDPTMSKNEIIKNVPQDISMDQWALFVEYRSKTTTKRAETGKTIGRGPMWNMTHKKKDGSYVNDEAREIWEKIDNHLSQRSEASSEFSLNDVVGVVFGKEHPGRVRGLGLGAVPTVEFKHTTTRLSGMNFGSSSSNTSSADLQQKVVTMESQLQALCVYISAKEGGSIPQELASFFPNSTPQAPDEGSGAPSPNNLRGSANGSNTHSGDLSRPPNDI